MVNCGMWLGSQCALVGHLSEKGRYDWVPQAFGVRQTSGLKANVHITSSQDRLFGICQVERFWVGFVRVYLRSLT